jgi:hypothetical protein
MIQAVGDRAYVYGIIPTGEAISFDCATVGGRDDRAHTVSHRDIAAVVSACAPTDYAALGRDLLVRELARHQQVVERVLQRFPVLPVKFGTTVEDEEKVGSILRLGYDDFRGALDGLKDKVQVELVATWELASVLADVACEEPIAQLKSSIGGDSSPASIQDRVRLGEMIKRSLDRRREEYERAALQRLVPCSLELRRNPLFHDSLVMNLAVLLEKGQQEEFDRSLDVLDQELGGRLTLRRVGPLAPYSFTTVEIHPIARPKIDQARKLLGIGRSASVSEIKKAYHQLARRFHPDAQSGGRDGSSDTRFAEIKGASKLLMDCCRAQLARREDGSRPIDEQQCSFEPDAIDEAVLMTIGPAGGDVL